MKSALLIGAAAAVALAQPHVHGHQHLHKKHANVVERDVVEEHVSVTVIECWLGGRALPESECQAGIKNGTLKWAGSNAAPAKEVVTSRIVVPSPKPSSSFQTSSSSPDSQVSSSLPVASPTPSPSSAAAAPSVANKVQAAPAAVANTGAKGLTADFPDGVIPCSQFPSDYGAVALDWLNIGGWASVQKPGVTNGAGFDNILGVTRGQCEGSTCCLEGSFCSYACPPGYLKYQWPTVQGATGQSVGGLLCKGGKLFKTNPSVGTLCGPGTSRVQVFVQNKMSKPVAICRTNYPGDEKMSIPVDAQPGTTRPLACPDASNYYMWQGKGTSAQYYINPAGYSIEKACVWGDYGDDFGNWAPGNLGVGFKDGRAWLSIMANLPTQPKSLSYTVELVGGSDTCRYRNGQYCRGKNYDDCNINGCTVSIDSGDIYYVLSD